MWLSGACTRVREGERSQEWTVNDEREDEREGEPSTARISGNSTQGKRVSQKFEAEFRCKM